MNLHEVYARQRKADRLVSALAQYGAQRGHVGLSALRRMDRAGWAELAELAAVNFPSEATKALVIEAVREQRAEGAR